MSRLSVTEEKGPDALVSLRAEWQELFAQAESASPFLSWEWITSWHARLGQSITPRIFCARSNGALVGVLPLGEARGRGRLTRSVRLLSFLGERLVGGDYLDVLQLDGLAGDSPTLALLAWRFAEDKAFEHNVTPYEICPYLRLADTGQEAIEASRRPHEFRRKLRQLTALSGFQVPVITAPKEVPAALERFFTLHDRRWAEQGGSDAMARPAVKAFHRDLVPGLAHAGAIRFEEIWAEGKCIASLYGINRKERFFFYQCGYDPDWARRSVGFVRLGLSIADAADRGVRVYDFLRGSEAYKFDWANAARSTLAVRISRRSAAGRAFVAGENLRAAAKLTARAVLPMRAVELLRRQRRRAQRSELRGVPAGAEQPQEKP